MDDIKKMLKEYINKIENNTLSYEDSMRLNTLYVETYGRDETDIDDEIASEQRIAQYLTMGWYVSSFLENNRI